MSDRLGAPFLGEVPIDTGIRAGGDRGVPIVIGEPDSPQTKAFARIAAAIASQLDGPDQTGAGRGPLGWFKKAFGGS
jgi:ATP-binding protein involved in chromosome partitioning